MLPKSSRLTRADFDSLSRGIVLHGSLFSLKTAPIPGGKASGNAEALPPGSKFAVVISAKTIKKATDRHLIKRRVMEAIQKAKTKEGYYCVFYAKSPALTATFQQINTEVISLLDRAHVLQ